MTGCHTCGGYGMHHDPVAHDAEPITAEENLAICEYVSENHDGRATPDEWDEADYRRDGDQALDALAASIARYDRQETGE